ncbi:MAG: hypothetical protein ACYDD1_19300 [Caulobacteraceae bacterium]
MQADSHPSPVTSVDRINLRLSASTFVEIDHARAGRPGNVSRNTWIAEAIAEKLNREPSRGVLQPEERQAHA